MHVTAKNLYPHRVTIDKMVEWRNHQEIIRWCRDAFGDDKQCITWQHALSGSPSMSHPEFSTYLFLHAEDALMFKMRWLDVGP